jgi:hypothetical protein
MKPNLREITGKMTHILLRHIIPQMVLETLLLYEITQARAQRWVLMLVRAQAILQAKVRV